LLGRRTPPAHASASFDITPKQLIRLGAMPLITTDQDLSGRRPSHSHTLRKQSQHSIFAKSVLMSKVPNDSNFDCRSDPGGEVRAPTNKSSVISELRKSNGISKKAEPPCSQTEFKSLPVVNGYHVPSLAKDGVGIALSDTPAPTVPSSPKT